MNRLKKLHVPLCEKVWLTNHELEAYLGFGSYDLFQRWRDTSLLPYYQVGKNILYKRKDIDTFIESFKIESQVFIS